MNAPRATNLEARVVGVGAPPALARLSRAINHMLDMADLFVREVSTVMEHLRAR